MYGRHGHRNAPSSIRVAITHPHRTPPRRGLGSFPPSEMGFYRIPRSHFRGLNARLARRLPGGLRRIGLRTRSFPALQRPPQTGFARGRLSPRGRPRRAHINIASAREPEQEPDRNSTDAFRGIRTSREQHARRRASRSPSPATAAPPSAPREADTSHTPHRRPQRNPPSLAVLALPLLNCARWRSCLSGAAHGRGAYAKISRDRPVRLLRVRRQGHVHARDREGRRRGSRHHC